ncbi:MAG: mechanosensitive ion channel domain-containing protein [Candidatus Omnitrophota bacterium]
MSKFIQILQDLVVKTLEEAYQFVFQIAPKVALSALILLIGLVCALLLKKIAAKVLKAIGLDVLSEKIGLIRFLERGGIQKRPSSIVGLVFYWLIMFSAFIMMSDAIGLEVLSERITQIFLYAPVVFVALILLALGIFFGRIIGKFVETTARLASIPFYIVLGKTARYLITSLAIMVALEHMNVSSAIMIEVFIIIFVVVPLASLLVLLIGGRELISNALAGKCLVKEYHKGDVIDVGSISGRLESIGFLTSKIVNEDSEIIVPNSDLLAKVVRKKK